MKSIAAFACACGLALAGCMNTYDLTQPVPELPQYEVAAQLHGNTWTIERLDGVSLQGNVIAAGRDGVVIVEESTGETRKVPAGDIALIRNSPNIGGPILGFLGGAFMGGMVGAMIGPAFDPFHLASPEAVRYGVAIGAMIGARGTLHREPAIGRDGFCVQRGRTPVQRKT